jgi:hypothetical protein
MKLVANIQLTPTKADAKLLRDTLERHNAASNVASDVGFEKFGPAASSWCSLESGVDAAYRRT